MTITNTNTKVSYVGNGSTTLFTVTFPFYQSSDLLVILEESDIETTQVLDTDYTVTGGSGSTGSITMTTAPTGTQTLYIFRNTPKTQETDYVENDKFPAESHEAALDKGVFISQELAESITRAALFKKSAGITGVEYPELSGNEGKALVVSDGADGIGVSTAVIADLLGDADTLTAANAAKDAAETAQAAAETARDEAVAAADANIIIDTVTSDPAPDSDDSNKCFIVDTTAGAVTVTLPLLSGLDSGYHLYFECIGGNQINFSTSGPDAIDSGFTTLASGAWLHMGYESGDNTWKVFEFSSNVAPGNDTEVLYNDSGVYGTSTAFTFDSSTGVLDVGTTGAVGLPSGTAAQRPSTPANGMIRYNTDDNDIEAYKGGSWTSFGYSGLTFDSTVAASGSSIEFTGIPSGTKRMRVFFEEVVTSASNGYIQMQLGTSGSYISTNYKGGVFSYENGTSTDLDHSTYGEILSSNQAASGFIDFTHVTGNKWFFQVSLGKDLGSGNGGVSVSGGYISLGAELTRVKFDVDNSRTYTGGNFHLMTDQS